MNVGYLVNQYPTTSHSFIRREITALETLGVIVVRYTLRRTTEVLVEEADRTELGKTAAVIAPPILSRCIAAFQMAVSHPLRFFKAFVLSVKLSLRSDRSFIANLAYLIEGTVVASWCARDQIDHLHVHFGTNSATVGMLVNSLIGIPWSFTAHGPEEFDRPLGISLVAKIESASFVAAISSFGRSQLWRWTRYEHWNKIHIVRCGLDTAFLNCHRVPIPTHPRLVCIGRLSEQKGQLLLVEAAQILRNKGVAFEMILVGDGPMRSQIERAVTTLGLNYHFSMMGWLDGQHVREEIERARALILPSFAEGLPVVIMEAMALGRPVVSTMVGGIPELVIPGETGWLAPAGDVEALAQAMIEVLELAPAALSAMGSRGRSRVLERHNARTEAAKLKLLFEGQGT